MLKGLEDNGRIRRGYFVAGLGATQFALPGALDLLRSLRTAPDEIEVVTLAATDPANPYGATLKWPASTADTRSAPADRADEPDDSRGLSRGRGPTRTVGATVMLVNGAARSLSVARRSPADDVPS